MARNPESLKNLKAGNKRGPAKFTMALKEAILQAAEQAGGPGGTVGYLKSQAMENPGPFMALLGKVLPSQVDLSNSDGTLARPQIILLRGPDDHGNPEGSA